MEEIKKTTFHLEDGRLADKVVQTLSDPATGEDKIVTEVYAEPKPVKKLSQRVIEIKKPVIVRREFEEVDDEGAIVSRRVETTEPEVRMELREHIMTNNSVSAQSVDDCNCFVTADEMKKCFTDGLIAVARAMKEEPGVAMQSVEEPKASNPVSVIGDKLNGFTKNLSGSALWIVAGALAAVLAYLALSS